MKTALWTLPPIAAGALLFGALASHAQGLKSHDSNAPVDFSADSIEVQDRSDRVVVTGNVQVTQGDLRLTADRLTVAYTRAGSVEINRMDAVGNVVVTRGDQTARGNTGIYDLDRRIITMVGNVQLTQGTNRLNGGRLVMDLNTGRSTVDGRPGGAPGVTGQSGGRVSGTFKVRQQNQPQNQQK
jgi:lipopolysaccharide export system protein LptA